MVWLWFITGLVLIVTFCSWSFFNESIPVLLRRITSKFSLDPFWPLASFMRSQEISQVTIVSLYLKLKLKMCFGLRCKCELTKEMRCHRWFMMPIDNLTKVDPCCWPTLWYTVHIDITVLSQDWFVRQSHTSQNCAMVTKLDPSSYLRT